MSISKENWIWTFYHRHLISQHEEKKNEKIIIQLSKPVFKNIILCNTQFEKSLNETDFQKLQEAYKVLKSQQLTQQLVKETLIILIITIQKIFIERVSMIQSSAHTHTEITTLKNKINNTAYTINKYNSRKQIVLIKLNSSSTYMN